MIGLWDMTPAKSRRRGRSGASLANSVRASRTSGPSAVIRSLSALSLLPSLENIGTFSRLSMPGGFRQSGRRLLFVNMIELSPSELPPPSSTASTGRLKSCELGSRH